MAPDEPDRRRRLRLSSVVLPTLAVSVIALLLGCIFVFPTYIVDRDLTGTRGQLTQDEHVKATNDVRTTLLQGLAGAFFLATAFFTWRQLGISQRQLRVAEDQQVSDRFTKAIEQLGSDKLDVRLGGIYSLERIAADSERDHGPIVEVLASFVRTRSTRSSDAGPTLVNESPSRVVTAIRRMLVGHAPASTAANRSAPIVEGPAPDIQAAMTVLGRRNPAHERHTRVRLDLRKVALPKVDLRYAHLQRSLLNDAYLEAADLRDAHLEDSRLVAAHLEHARLRAAHLQGARLVKAHLDGAQLFRAHLEGANLLDAHLEGARLGEAHLSGAILCRAHLQGAYLRTAHGLGQADLSGAVWDTTTTWPDGFQPESHTQATPA